MQYNNHSLNQPRNFMKIIKAASIYKATLPDPKNLAVHLEEKSFIEMQPSEAQSIGFVPRESSKKMAGLITSVLIHAVGSVKTQTIHVSEVKQGLTTRLQAWLDGDDDAFGDYHPHGDVALQSGTQKLTIKMDSLQTANLGLKEAITKQFRVTSIGLQADIMDFRLTSDFAFQSINFGLPGDGGEDTEQWVYEAAFQVSCLSGVLSDLCDMFGYKPPVDENDALDGEAAE